MHAICREVVDGMGRVHGVEGLVDADHYGAGPPRAGSVNYKDLLVRPGDEIRLADIDPGNTYEFKDKADARSKLERDIEKLTDLQDVFAAAASCALLIVLQGMDSSGKDGAIKHVMSGVNPQGVDVFSFKQPTEEELRHDFLWRAERVLPERGRIGIFNRSYYEEVLVVRVHSNLLDAEAIHGGSGGANIWAERYADINAFEQHLVRNDTHVLKFFLHISKEEQKRRLLARLDDPTKTWKFSFSDEHEREYWDAYMSAYERMLGATSTEWAHWYVIPSDRKWFTRTAVADILVAKLESLGLQYPSVGPKQREVLDGIRTRLETETTA